MKKLILLLLFFVSLPVFCQEENEFEFFLKGTSVTDIYSTGNEIWIATNGAGIFCYYPKTDKWIQYSTSKGNLLHDFFYCVTANESYVWAGSIDGLFILDRKSNNWSKRKFGLGGQLANWIRSIAYDKYEKAVWIGRFQYLTKYDLKNKKYTDYDLTVHGNAKTNTIKTIKVDGDSVVWFGTEAGLHKYDKSKNLNNDAAIDFYDNRYNYFNGQGDQVSISSILLERNNVWLGTDEFVTQERPEFNLGGLFRFNKKNDWFRFDDSKGLTGNGVYALERIGNYVWASLYQFGSSTKEIYGRGLAVINRVTNKVVPIRDEKIPQDINTLFFDGTNLWLGTNSGLIKINFFNKLAQWAKGVK
jgi:ligand-binding sensor domain-containing protein